MRPAQITLSTLAIGSDSDTRLLTSLARLGGGRYYFTERSAQIPRIASKETTILTRNAVVEGQVAAVVDEPSPILRGLSGDLPDARGLRGHHAQGPRGHRAGDRTRPSAAGALAVRTGSRRGLDVRGAAGLGQRLGELARGGAVLVAGGALGAAGAGAGGLPARGPGRPDGRAGVARGAGAARRRTVRRPAGHARDGRRRRTARRARLALPQRGSRHVRR